VPSAHLSRQRVSWIVIISRWSGRTHYCAARDVEHLRLCRDRLTTQSQHLAELLVLARRTGVQAAAADEQVNLPVFVIFIIMPASLVSYIAVSFFFISKFPLNCSVIKYVNRSSGVFRNLKRGGSPGVHFRCIFQKCSKYCMNFFKH